MQPFNTPLIISDRDLQMYLVYLDFREIEKSRLPIEVKRTVELVRNTFKVKLFDFAFFPVGSVHLSV